MAWGYGEIHVIDSKESAEARVRFLLDTVVGVMGRKINILGIGGDATGMSRSAFLLVADFGRRWGRESRRIGLGYREIYVIYG